MGEGMVDNKWMSGFSFGPDQKIVEIPAQLPHTRIIIYPRVPPGSIL